ncbi:MAG: FAD-dependent oxidoreductase [Chloroflexi bacterium]|nr:FAD-dependent oxidoreductase [Chloroflexota bacterium]
MRIAIVGAGAAGLAAGRTLAAQGHDITIYEKSRGFGGRAATRRTHDCALDHGAQYLEVDLRRRAEYAGQVFGYGAGRAARDARGAPGAPLRGLPAV